MDKQRNKKHMAYGSLLKYFEDYGDDLAAAYPVIGTSRITFTQKYAAMILIIDDINKINVGISKDKKKLKTECLDEIWQLVSAMKYHFTFTDNTTGADLVKISYSVLAIYSEAKFFTFCQSVMNLYDPAIYNAFEIDENKMVALKAKLVDFPNKMRTVSNARAINKKAVAKLIEKQRDMDYFLKNGLTPLIDVVDGKFKLQKLQYKLAIHIGIPNIAKGKPHKHGKPAAGQTMVLDKKPFRNKLCIIVSNVGKTPLLAGRSSNQTQIEGTPFIIEPGKMRRRISQKLGSKGQYILIQNVGDEE